jgi:hypothetical protein
MPAGSLQQWIFKFTYLVNGFEVPYPISGATWEYVARTSQTDTGTPLISLTTTGSANGVLVVTATVSLSQVLLEIYPPATVSLDGEYWHSLWMNPGNSTSAFTWFTGPLIVQGNPQP